MSRRPLTATACALALCLVLPAAYAQEAAEEAEATDQASAQEPAETEPERPAGDPFDYEASEQISEDLSVSFPVDI